MNTKKDGQGKDGSKPAEAPGAKKPYATLDLKATEIKNESKDAKPADVKPSAASATPGSVSAAAAPANGKPDATTTTTAAKPGEAKPGATDTKGAASSGAATNGKPQEKQPYGKPAPGAPGKPAPQAAAAPTRGGGGFISHLVAGIAGGLLALLGAEPIGQQLGMQIGGGGEATAQMQQRLAHIEAGLKGPGPQSELAQKLAAAETRLAKLDEVARSVVALSEGQAKIEGEAKMLSEKIGGQADPTARITKLEDTLATIAAAATADPQAGRVPQIAAVTGKLKDLETSLATQIAALRRGVTQEIDQRVTQAAESGEAAKAGTQRLDRELATAKTDATRLAQRVEGLKAESERTAQALRVVQEEAGTLKSGLDALKGDFDARFKTVARAGDVSGAVAPVASKLAELETSVQSVVKSEAERRSTAERIVLALELNNLKRVIDRGQKFAPELAEVKKVSGTKIDLSVLDKFKDAGVPALTDLTRDFRAIMHKMIEADTEPEGGSVVDKFIAGAKSVVRVRKTDHAASDKSAEAVIARMEAALKDGRLGVVIEEAKALSAKALAPAKDWLGRVEARSAVDKVIASIENELKTSLSGAAPPKASN